MLSVSAASLDDLMRQVFERILGGHTGNIQLEGNRKGKNTEVFGAFLELRDPRARLSRSQGKGKIFSALGELLWYLSGSNEIDFIDYYLPGYGQFSDDNSTANGAYGPRLFGPQLLSDGSTSSQYERAMDQLRAKPETRNAVVQIFRNSDAEKRPNGEHSLDIPCTTTLQFAVRRGKLSLHTHMRSNDAFRGLPHDIFSFTMLQEIAARELELGIGTYLHSVGSLHLYDDKRDAAQRFLNEGYFEQKPMPSMPVTNPWPEIHRLIEAEQELRTKGPYAKFDVPESDYWADLVRVLRAYSAFKQTPRAISVISEVAKEMASDVYGLYLRDRLERELGPAQVALDL